MGEVSCITFLAYRGLVETIIIAGIAAFSSIIVASITHLAGRGQRKTLQEVKLVVDEQLVNEHKDAEFPNNRDELTAVRMAVKDLGSAVEAVAVQTSGLGSQIEFLGVRLGVTNATVVSLEDAFGDQYDHAGSALSRAVDKHDRDVVDLKASIAGVHLRVDRLENLNELQ